MRRKLAVIAVLSAMVLPVFAQAPAAVVSTRVYGTVESFSGNKLVVKSSNGEDTTLAVPPDVKIVSIRLGKLSDIKQGDFVGSAAVEAPDGKLKAREVHIFPESMRGQGDGHRPMGQDANSSMTNGTVTGARKNTSMTNGTVTAADGGPTGRILKVSYKGGEQEIEVGPEVPVRFYVLGDTSLLKPGSTVEVSAAQRNDTLTANIIHAEKDGVKPPKP
ncbi:MAG: hypothetical protein WAN14_15425 [Candidatus Acidiferrales bacterium]